MDEQTIVNTDNAETGTAEQVDNSIQADNKTFTQEQVDAIVTKRLSQAQKKFADVDVNEYQELKQLRDRVEERDLIERKDFDTLLKKTKDKYETELNSARGQLESIKIDGALIDAASKLKSAAPEQTARLLRDSLRLDSSGSVVIVDGDTIRYNDDAEPMTVEQLVEEFLTTNTHFRSAGPSGTASEGNAHLSQTKTVDISQLDMSNPDHRKTYRELKQKGLA